MHYPSTRGRLRLILITRQVPPLFLQTRSLEYSMTPGGRLVTLAFGYQELISVQMGDLCNSTGIHIHARTLADPVAVFVNKQLNKVAQLDSVVEPQDNLADGYIAVFVGEPDSKR